MSEPGAPYIVLGFGRDARRFEIVGTKLLGSRPTDTGPARLILIAGDQIVAEVILHRAESLVETDDHQLTRV